MVGTGNQWRNDRPTQNEGRYRLKDSNDAACADDSRMEVSLGRGVSSYFDVDDITISVWGSAWSGREVVRVDDRVVCDRRSFRMSTPHRFDHGGHQYEVIFSTESVLRGRYRVELYRHGVLVDSDSAGYAMFGGRSGSAGWYVLPLLFVTGLLAGVGLAALARASGGH